MHLMRVIPDTAYVLIWPESVPAETRARGMPGYVVDLDAPMEKEWCAGQMHKFIEAPDATEPTQIIEPGARLIIRNLMAKTVTVSQAQVNAAQTVEATTMPKSNVDQSKIVRTGR